MTAEERLRRAERVVREQRDPEGELGGVGGPASWVPVYADEALLMQELERLQRAVMGEPEPGAVEP